MKLFQMFSLAPVCVCMCVCFSTDIVETFSFAFPSFECNV